MFNIHFLSSTNNSIDKIGTSPMQKNCETLVSLTHTEEELPEGQA